MFLKYVQIFLAKKIIYFKQKTLLVNFNHGGGQCARGVICSVERAVRTRESLDCRITKRVFWSLRQNTAINLFGGLERPEMDLILRPTEKKVSQFGGFPSFRSVCSALEMEAVFLRLVLDLSIHFLLPDYVLHWWHFTFKRKCIFRKNQSYNAGVASFILLISQL